MKDTFNKISLGKKKLNFFKHKEETKSTKENSILTCHRVTKSYGALNAVNKLSFEIPEGIVYGIGGPNGAGKTTLFDLISGVQKVNNGEIIFNRQNITNQNSYKICHAGIARTFQLNAAFETMTVRENVLIGVQHGLQNNEIPNLYFSNQDISNADYALSFVGLENIKDKIVSSLTHLELKLLMIASAISTNPKLLLLDEPVGGLIPNEIEKVEKVVSKLTQEKKITIILIEHVMRFLVGLSDEVMIMNHGEKLYEGLPEKMAEDKTVVDVYLGEGTSANFEKIQASKKLKKEIPLADTNIENEILDEWATSVEKVSRILVSQKKSGKIYPIDFMNLAKTLDQKKDKTKSTKISRAADGLIKAHKESANLNQHFELLERMIEEASMLRKKIPELKIKNINNEKDRSNFIEKAALDLIHASDENRMNERDIEKLKKAISWDQKKEKEKQVK
ncbi:MAG: hypothetical protein CMI90_06710 [Pelagibacteraceae bacterium]|nr:hypothetical protein [Pelagibacteraceae bacterium]